MGEGNPNPPLGILFPGQGSQHLGMGDELLSDFPVFRRTFQEAEETLNLRLVDLMSSGPEEEIRLTSNAQPLLLAFSVGVFRILQEEFDLEKWKKFAAGHSLGEYSALVCAEVLSFEDGIRLARKRGELMSSHPGGMMAILGMKLREVEQHLDGGCEIANDNCPGQVVISGSDQALAHMREKLKGRPCRVVPLSVSGPFHSRFMVEPKNLLSKYMEEEKIQFRPGDFPVISNVGTVPYEHGKEKELLLKQMSNRVEWHASMARMIKDDEVRMMVELGPKSVLTGLLKRIDSSISCTPVNSPSSLECCQFLEQEVA